MTTLTMFDLDDLIQRLTERGRSTEVTVQAAFELRSMRQKLEKADAEIEKLKLNQKDLERKVRVYHDALRPFANEAERYRNYKPRPTGEEFGEIKLKILYAARLAYMDKIDWFSNKYLKGGSKE